MTKKLQPHVSFSGRMLEVAGCSGVAPQDIHRVQNQVQILGHLRRPGKPRKYGIQDLKCLRIGPRFQTLDLLPQRHEGTKFNPNM